MTFASGDIGLYEGIWNGPGPWACTVTTPRRRWELRPLEKAVFQNAGERKLNPVDAACVGRGLQAGLPLAGRAGRRCRARRGEWRGDARRGGRDHASRPRHLPGLSASDGSPHLCRHRNARRIRSALLADARDQAGSRDLALQIVATAMHLEPAFGHTVDLIRQDGFTVDAEVPMQLSRATSRSISRSRRARLSADLPMRSSGSSPTSSCCSATVSKRWRPRPRPR